MLHHNFMIAKGENQEKKIEEELQMLRNKNKGFLVNQMNVQTTSLGCSFVTVQYTKSE